jgi:hypothetical protein
MSIATVSTHRPTRAQPAMSLSSNDDTANSTEPRSCPATPPTHNSCHIIQPTINSRPVTPSTANKRTNTLSATSPVTPTHNTSSLLSSPSSIASPLASSESDPGTPPGLLSCSDSDSDSEQPPSPPGLLSCSDSDSDSDQSSYITHTTRLSVNMSQNTRTTLLNTKMTARFSVEPGKPPIITGGELTPELLADFENGCLTYFAWKDVAADRQVMKIAWGLQDTHMQVWYQADRDAINTAGFTAFMASIWKHWLPAGWEHNVKCLILSSSQGNSPVADWIHLLESTNTVLVSTTSHLETANLHNHIETHLHSDTQIAAHLAETHLILDYAAYVRAIKLIDNAHIRQAALVLPRL